MFAAGNTDVALLAPTSSMHIRVTGERGEPEQDEIRLGWSAEICHFGHEIQSFAVWCAANPWLRRDFEIMVVTANEVFGDATHWIEERPAYQTLCMFCASDQPQG